jgi:hypothetical protein
MLCEYCVFFVIASSDVCSRVLLSGLAACVLSPENTERRYRLGHRMNLSSAFAKVLGRPPIAEQCSNLANARLWVPSSMALVPLKSLSDFSFPQGQNAPGNGCFKRCGTHNLNTSLVTLSKSLYFDWPILWITGLTWRITIFRKNAHCRMNTEGGFLGQRPSLVCFCSLRNHTVFLINILHQKHCQNLPSNL